MTVLGWVVMVLSVSFVSTLLVWCYSKVFAGTAGDLSGKPGGGIVWKSERLRALDPRLSKKKITRETLMNRREGEGAAPSIKASGKKGPPVKMADHGKGKLNDSR